MHRTALNRAGQLPRVFYSSPYAYEETRRLHGSAEKRHRFENFPRSRHVYLQAVAPRGFGPLSILIHRLPLNSYAHYSLSTGAAASGIYCEPAIWIIRDGSIKSERNVNGPIVRPLPTASVCSKPWHKHRFLPCKVAIAGI